MGMIEDILADLHLSDKEVAIYTTLLTLGKATAARISSASGINRTTVYAVCKELAAKGFIQEDSTKEIIFYSPTPPTELTKILKRERQALIERELKLEELAKEVRELPQSKKYVVPKMRFVEHEDKVIEFLHERSPMWLESQSPENKLWYGYQDHTLVSNPKYVEWIDWYWKDHKDTTKVFLLTNMSEAERSMEERRYVGRNIKFWKKGFDFTVSQWIVGDYSIMVMTNETPHYLVEIHDAVYADNMRKLFQNLWEDIP